jgi:hypothetical protein
MKVLKLQVHHHMLQWTKWKMSSISFSILPEHNFIQHWKCRKLWTTFGRSPEGNGSWFSTMGSCHLLHGIWVDVSLSQETINFLQIYILLQITKWNFAFSYFKYPKGSALPHRAQLTSNFLCGGMDVFWNDPLLIDFLRHAKFTVLYWIIKYSLL